MKKLFNRTLMILIMIFITSTAVNASSFSNDVVSSEPTRATMVFYRRYSEVEYAPYVIQFTINGSQFPAYKTSWSWNHTWGAYDVKYVGYYTTGPGQPNEYVLIK